jgi:hypothetical protein
VYHSYIITEENGDRLYGVCVIFYEQLRDPVRKSLESMMTEWRAHSISNDDMDVYRHTFDTLKQLYAEYALNPLNETMDQIHLYESVIKNYPQAVFVNLEKEVWVPHAATLTSKFPFYSLMKDWLCKTIEVLTSRTALPVPFERYLVHLIDELPLPPPGKLMVRFKLEDIWLTYSLPPLNTCPLVKDVRSSFGF